MRVGVIDRAEFEANYGVYVNSPARDRPTSKVRCNDMSLMHSIVVLTQVSLPSTPNGLEMLEAKFEKRYGAKAFKFEAKRQQL